jgi:single-strand DNA-binding protein
MNHCSLIGRLVRDVELKTTEKSSVVRFTLAVNRQYKKEGEERQADFISVVAFNKTAEFISKYFSKGSQMAIVGKINTGSYEKEGQKIYTTDVIADAVYFCGSKQEQKGDAYEGDTVELTGNMVAIDSNDSELPF